MKTRIQEIRAKLNAYIHWQEHAGQDVSETMAPDIADLLAVVEVYEDCLTKIEVELGEDDDNIYIAEAREALTKAQAILDKGGL